MTFALAGKRVFVAGHRGMVGSAILRRLAGEGCVLLTAARSDLDLRRQFEVEAWFAYHRPEVVFLAAATVGGILANDTRPAEFLYDNLAIETMLIEASRRANVEKLLFLGSSCIYPRLASQPMDESQLLGGPLEPTNQWYAIAKIAGIKLCQAYRLQYGCDFISVMPTNLYGPGDNFDLHASHVIPALMVKAHRAKLAGARSMEVWGSGTPTREFLHVDDLADACVHVMKTYAGGEPLNVGTGEEISIRDLATLVAKTVGFEGALHFDAHKPDGTPRKLLDISRIAATGWRARMPLHQGLAEVYSWFTRHASDPSVRGINP